MFVFNKPRQVIDGRLAPGQWRRAARPITTRWTLLGAIARLQVIYHVIKVLTVSRGSRTGTVRGISDVIV